MDIIINVVVLAICAGVFVALYNLVQIPKE